MKESVKKRNAILSLITCGLLTCASMAVLSACKVTDNTSSVASPHEHVWDSGTVTKEATCIQEGEFTYNCTVENCSSTKIAIIAKTEHAWGEGVITIQADCVTEGEKSYTCSVCKESRTEKIAKTQHIFNADNECTICHAKMTNSFSADSLTKGIYNENLTVDGTNYVVYANSLKDVWIEDKTATFDGGKKTYKKVIKLNGRANVTGEFAVSRVIGMTFNKAGSITVFVSAGGTNKNVALYDSSGTLISQQTLGVTDAKYTFEITRAGTYYIGGDTTTGSLYVYGIDFS